MRVRVPMSRFLGLAGAVSSSDIPARWSTPPSSPGLLGLVAPSKAFRIGSLASGEGR
jgi:hypothetical protein